MSKRLQFSALECMVTKDLPSLLRHEWSMGNGQCPECYGHPPDWFGHPLFLKPDKIGHRTDCVMAAAFEQLGAEHRLREGEFKSDVEYEVYWPNGFMSTRVKRPDNPPDLIGEELRRKWDKIWMDSFMELGKGLEALSDGSEDRMMDLLDRLRSAEKVYDEGELGAFWRKAMLDAAEEIERLEEIIRARGQHADACDFYGECHCELKEFQLGQR